MEWNLFQVLVGWFSPQTLKHAHKNALSRHLPNLCSMLRATYLSHCMQKSLIKCVSCKTELWNALHPSPFYWLQGEGKS